jgi:hypothetical protein
MHAHNSEGGRMEALGTALNLVFSAVNAADGVVDAIETQEQEEKASKVTKAIFCSASLLFNGGSLAARKNGARDFAQFLKVGEILTTVGEAAFSIGGGAWEIKNKGCTPQRITSLVEKGILRPLISTARAACESSVMSEEKYLEMSPEELKNARRPVNRGSGEDPDIIYVPVDREECQKNYDASKAAIPSFRAVEIACRIGIAERVVESASKFFDTLINAAAIEEEVEREAHAAEQDASPPPEVDPSNLRALPYIPESLEQDRLFSQLECQIYHTPTRYPVLDPTNRISLYDGPALFHALHHGPEPRSPITRMPLRLADVVLLPKLQELVDDRLKIYEWHINEAIRTCREMPVNQQLLTAAREELVEQRQRNPALSCVNVVTFLDACIERPRILAPEPRIEEIVDNIQPPSTPPQSPAPALEAQGANEIDPVTPPNAFPMKLGEHNTLLVLKWADVQVFTALSLRDRRNRVEQAAPVQPIPTGNAFIEWILTLEDAPRWINRDSLTIIVNHEGEDFLKLKERFQQAILAKEEKNLQTLADNPSSLREIPVTIRYQPPFNEIQCPLTRSPIRFAVTYDGEPEDRSPRAYYESAAIREWFKKNPTIPPPGWPQNLPFTGSNVTFARQIQLQIDEALGKASKEIRK